MKHVVFALLLVVANLQQCDAQTSWQTVMPSIQSYLPLDTATVDSVGFGSFLHINFLNDSLAWAAYELKTQLLGITAWNNQDIKANRIPLGQAHDVQSQDSLRSRILMDIWNEDSPSVLQQFLSESQNPDFGLPPDARTGSEESYYIWVQNGIHSDSLEPTPFVNAIIVAPSVRGALYAVTTMRKAAIFQSDSLAWPEGFVVDYPTFERRIVGDKYDIGDSAQFGNSEVEHAHGIIAAARNVLLENKGNGLIQFSHPAKLSTV